MLILGHRGAIIDGTSFHQNSTGAFREALETADGFETDACVDRDGEIFLIHEAKYADATKGVEYCATEHLDAASTERMGKRRIDELSTDEMRSLRLKDGTPIPLLKDVLALVGKAGKIINIELKAYNVTEHVVKMLMDAFQTNVIRPENIIVSSFNHFALPDMRAKLPGVKIGAIVMEDDMPSAALFPWQPGSTGAYSPLTKMTLDQPVLKQAQPDVFVMPEKLLTQESINLVAMHFPKAQLSGWVFTERGNFELADLKQRLNPLRPTGKIASVLVDNPRKYAPLLR